MKFALPRADGGCCHKADVGESVTCDLLVHAGKPYTAPPTNSLASRMVGNQIRLFRQAEAQARNSRGVTPSADGD